MAVETKSAKVIANRDASPSLMGTAANTNGLMRESVGVVAVAASASVGSKYLIAEIGSGDRLSEILVKTDALGAGAAADFGLYEQTIRGGTVVNVNIFGGAQAIATATTLTISLSPANMDKMIWELLGLAQDPSKQYDIVATITTAATAGGNMGVRVRTAV